jgi:D-arginine dehydrogenase
VAKVDFVVIGGGIAGASLAYWLTERASVLLLEREPFFGYHATGRSAAVYVRNYGNAVVQSLTRASRRFFDGPPGGFAEHSLLRPRGCLYLARTDQLAALSRQQAECVASERLTPAEARARVPVLRDHYLAAALSDPGLDDIDVDLVHQGFLRGARRKGAQLRTGAPVEAIERRQSSWRVTAAGETHDCAAVINAAGAWVEQVGAMAGAAPIGLRPLRRTAMLLDPPASVAVDRWPLVVDVDERFYFKPEGGKVMLSPADETPLEPQDAQPEEIDLAIAVDRLQQAADFPVTRIAKRWAGLRSFVADRSPAVGYDASAPGFFWLAGQGGFGIQTSPAMGRLASALALGEAVPDDIVEAGIAAPLVDPGRRQPAWSES